jgi:hypothetical protein
MLQQPAPPQIGDEFEHLCRDDINSSELWVAGT